MSHEQDCPKAQNGPSGDTAQRIADEYGIGRNTVKRAEKFAKVVGSHLATQPKTSEVLGSEYGVHKSTIIRNANFAKVVDILPEEAKNDVLSGGDKKSAEYKKSIAQNGPFVLNQYTKVASYQNDDLANLL